jgi:HYR domain
VDYTAPSADDAVDPQPSVSCDTPSGSTFAIGSTTVTCTATDAAGNAASASFTVSVKGLSLPKLGASTVKVKRGKLVLAFAKSQATGSGSAVLKIGGKKAGTAKLSLVKGKAARVTFKLTKSVLKALKHKTKNATLAVTVKAKNGMKGTRSYTFKVKG